MRENGFTINPLKCEWAVKETDWLGYWLTPRGLKPWRKKIDAVLKMERPQNATELRMFIGAVNYYKDMWPSRAHVLKTLTDMSGLKKKQTLKWTAEMQSAFDKMRQPMVADVLSAYPDHNKRFDVFTDASDFQLGSCIMQDGRTVAYFCCLYTRYLKHPVDILRIRNIQILSKHWSQIHHSIGDDKRTGTVWYSMGTYHLKTTLATTTHNLK